jgi:Protein of unknown function (DUF3237)
MQEEERSKLIAPGLEFVMQLRVEIGEPLELGEVQGVAKRIIPITGGSFEGPQLRGVVLEGGADWQTVRPDGVAVLYARYTLKTESGELITVENRGFRHGARDLASRILSGERVPASEYYFMTSPVFETSAEGLEWLTRTVFVGAAERERERVIINVWRVGDEPAPAVG